MQYIALICEKSLHFVIFWPKNYRCTHFFIKFALSLPDRNLPLRKFTELTIKVNRTYY